MHSSRRGLTLIEVMCAVAIGSFVAGIGFTGITALSRSITRAKQFASETELITALMRQAIARADNKDLDISATPTLETPTSWTNCKITGPNSVEFSLKLTATSKGTTATTGDVRKALQMSADKNTLQLKTIACYSP